MKDDQWESLARLYRSTRREQPSARLDRKIRNQARRALATRRHRWLWGLSTAAVLVLSFSVVINLQVDDIDDGQPVQAEKSTDAWKPKQADLAVPPPVEIEAARKRMLGDMAEMQSAEQRRMTRMPPAATAATPRRQAEEDRDAAHAFTTPAPVRFEPPDLPHDAEQLVQLADGLAAQTSSSGLSIFAGDKLVLSLKPDGAKTVFRAWRGAESLGVKLDWAISPERLLSCNTGIVYLRCQLGERAEAFFESSRLDHIRWEQVHE